MPIGVVGGQQRDEERRPAHQQHAQDQHVLPAVRVTPVAEDERADRPGDVADTERRERRDDGDLRVVRREEDVREDQRRGLRVDEEVVVLQRAADPAARRGLLRRLRVLGRFVRARRARRSRLPCSSPRRACAGATCGGCGVSAPLVICSGQRHRPLISAGRQQICCSDNGSTSLRWCTVDRVYSGALPADPGLREVHRDRLLAQHMPCRRRPRRSCAARAGGSPN